LESYKIGLKAILMDNRFLQTVITNSEIENIAETFIKSWYKRLF